MSNITTNGEFFELVKGDAEALTLLKKLDSPHTPLTVEDLPYQDSGTVNSNLHRLFELEKHGWVTVREKTNSDKCVLKEFDISEKGKKLLSNL